MIWAGFRRYNSFGFFIMNNLSRGHEMSYGAARYEQIVAKLEAAGHRITPQRLCIVEALLASDRHPSAEEIFAQVRLISPTTSLATIYKTLDTLKSLGEVLEVESWDNRTHFDGLRPSPHPHIVCTGCGRIDDIDLQGVSALQSEAERVSGFKVDEQRLEFYGRCLKCQETTAANMA